MQPLEAQILDYLALTPATRAQLARYCGYLTPGYMKGHPFRKAIEKLVAEGKIVRRGKYRLTSSQVEANEVEEMDKTGISFSGPFEQTMEKAFLKLKREYPNVHAKCKDVYITVRNGEIQIEDLSDELLYEEIKLLKDFLKPYVLEGKDGEPRAEKGNDDGIIRIGVPEGTEKDVLGEFMYQLLGENAKLVESIHLKNDDWDFKISKSNIPLRITTDSASGLPSLYFKNEECV